jgi:ParB family chromosome partitioning protein
MSADKKKDVAGTLVGVPKPGASRSQARKDEMRAFAVQAAANSPGLEERINQAKGLIEKHPLRPEQEAPEVPASNSKPDAAPEKQVADKSDESANPPRAHVATPRGRYELVPLNKIVENPFNARKTYREARVKEMTASLAANGQETPGTATIRDGVYILAAGHYRFKGLQELHAPSMGMMIIEGLSDKDLYEISYRENAEREDQTPFDNALAWRSNLDTKLYETEMELANAIGLSTSNVTKTLGILRLSEPIRELIAQEPARYPLSLLYELALFEPVGGPTRTMALAKAIASGEVSRQQIQDARAQLQEKKPRKGRETSRQYTIQVGGTSEGTLKEWDSGKVAFEVQIEDPVARSEFVAEMRKRFAAPQ